MAKTETGGDIPGDIREMSFETALAALEEIVQKLESGEVDLEESIAAYTRGTQLKLHCEAKLKDAQARVEKIKVGPGGGAAGLEAMDVD